jgi:farnesyl-diphosphate farnesyltransferase
MGSIPPELSRILKGVSRSFYLSLRVLPAPLREPLGVAYLLARAADTVADTRIVPRADRLAHLETLRRAVADGMDDGSGLAAALTGPQAIPMERELLLALPAILTTFRALIPADRQHIQALLAVLLAGMATDLRTFPQDTAAGLAALDTPADLDRYTYQAAGCVGEFWTEMALAHRPALAAWDREAMRRLGKRFGQALQLTNVLRDLPQDLRIGRCYLPRESLAAAGLVPQDLLDASNLPRLRPVLRAHLAEALDRYADGWAYIAALPAREARLRLACLWPLYIGLATLEAIALAPRLLDATVRVKIPRSAVYRLMISSTLLVRHNPGLQAIYTGLRDRVVAGMA